MCSLYSIFLVPSRVVVRLDCDSSATSCVKCEGPLCSKSKGHNQIDHGVGVRIVLS